jgi:hypothetical protein
MLAWWEPAAVCHAELDGHVATLSSAACERCTRSESEERKREERKRGRDNGVDAGGTVSHPKRVARCINSRSARRECMCYSFPSVACAATFSCQASNALSRRMPRRRTGRGSVGGCPFALRGRARGYTSSYRSPQTALSDLHWQKRIGIHDVAGTLWDLGHVAPTTRMFGGRAQKNKLVFRGICGWLCCGISNIRA